MTDWHWKTHSMLPHCYVKANIYRRLISGYPKLLLNYVDVESFPPRRWIFTKLSFVEYMWHSVMVENGAAGSCVALASPSISTSHFFCKRVERVSLVRLPATFPVHFNSYTALEGMQSLEELRLIDKIWMMMLTMWTTLEFYGSD